MFKKIGKTNVDNITSTLSQLTTEDWNKWKELQTLYNSDDSTLAYGLFWAMPDKNNYYKVVIHDDSSNVAKACQPLIKSLVNIFKTQPIAAAFSLLKERRVIPMHVDVEYHGIHRIHVPIVTNAQVYMFGQDLQLHNWKAGYIYDLDATKPHGIVNGSRLSRIHLVIDFPSPEFVKEIVYETARSTV